ncbi:MAG TPA: DUF805 domain-containing protein [Caulobacteraceae bacterium]|jgi:uncharacterized membrane protein YhaH (DUF805 family)|nr:DUF805 domain-containing protein [Caulobacteraceae bacterium]
MFTALQKYAVFNGRARRSEYWLFILLEIILLVAALVIGMVIDRAAGHTADPAHPMGGLGFLLYGLVALGLFLPALGVTIRRLHDTNRSGWWYLIAFIPFGGIVLLVFFCLEGTSGPNKYGADPKMPPAATAETFA